LEEIEVRNVHELLTVIEQVCACVCVCRYT
jgi:hypothetical protein